MASTIDLVAVTGTNGKSSVVWYAQRILTATGHPAASYGSLGVVTPSRHDLDPELPPDARTIPALVEQLRDEVRTLVFEATSFALARGVLDQLRLRAGVFTNLSQDHLDVHGGSMSIYLGAKGRLFSELLPPSAAAILGEDDASEVIADHLSSGPIRVVRIGPTGDLALLRRELTGADGCAMLHLRVEGREVAVNAACRTDFQAVNLLFGVAVAVELGVPAVDALATLAAMEHPPGRFELLGQVGGVEVIVDYAHNPHALATVLRAARGLTDGRVGVVFGCGGERDREKRDPMGRIAGELADVVVVTDDNPRREDAAEIRSMILAACSGALEVPDRKEAIEAGLAKLTAGDVLVVAGRGDERFQQIGERSIVCSDRELVAQVVG